MIDAVERALSKLGLPNVAKMSKDELAIHVHRWRQRIFDFKPEKKKKEKVEFGPEPLSSKQREVIVKMEKGMAYTKEELGCSVTTIRSLLKKGYLLEQEDARWRIK